MSLAPFLTRTLAAIAAALAAIIALSACGPAETQTGTQSNDSSLLPVAEGTTSYPLTLETAYGETTLEERPERIAVIGGLGDQESVLALGIAPVVGSDSGMYYWNNGTRFNEVDVFVDPWADAFEFEKLLAAEPDLIVASTYGKLEDDFERLASIAPVLAIAPSGDYAWDWRELVRSVGEATDLADLADQQVTETESRIAEAAAAHPEYVGRTVSIIINRGQEAGIQFVNTGASPAAELLNELGFAEHPNLVELDKLEWGDVSIENIGLVDAEALIVARHGGDDTVEAATEWLEGNPLYQQLGAVQAERVAFIDPNPETGGLDLAWAFAYPNVLANRWVVGELTTSFEGLFG